MSKQTDFINKLAPIIQKVALQRGYNFPSAIIAQSILESGWGDSMLAKYHNYFGMKASKDFKGQTVGMNTQEQRADGSYYTIHSMFRAYPDDESGIEGYFNFIESYSRYKNLKYATSSRNYLELIRADGYCTSLKYVDNVYNVVKKWDLEKYDNKSYKAETVNEIPKDLELAAQVFARYAIAGLLGNGEDRKNRIYKIVQNEVNKNVR